MKKQFITVFAITACTICAFCAASCDKDDEESNKEYCTCTGKDSYGNTDSDIVFLSEFGASSCSQLTSILANRTPGVKFSCH